MSGEHWRMRLNNYLQTNGLRGQISFTQGTVTGPQNAPTWTVSAYYNNVEYGRGSALTRGAATEIAAEQALKALWAQRG